MKGKILFLTGLGLGYVLGTKAGREKYEELKNQATKLWNDPRVQKQVDAVEGFVKEKAPEVADFVSDNAKKVVDQVSGKKPTGRSGGSNGGSATSGGTGSTGSTGSSSGAARTGSNSTSTS